MIISEIKVIIINDIRKMSSVLCDSSGLVRDILREHSPYIIPVRMNGISMVLFTI